MIFIHVLHNASLHNISLLEQVQCIYIHEQRTLAGETLIPASHILKICKSFIWWSCLFYMGSKSNNLLLEEIIGGDFLSPGGADHQRWFEAGRESWYMLYNVSMLLEFKTSNVVALTLNAIWLWLRNKKIVSHENYHSWYVINVVFMIFLLFFSLFFSFPPKKIHIILKW